MQCCSFWKAFPCRLSSQDGFAISTIEVHSQKHNEEELLGSTPNNCKAIVGPSLYTNEDFALNEAYKKERKIIGPQQKIPNAQVLEKK